MLKVQPIITKLLSNIVWSHILCEITLFLSSLSGISLFARGLSFRVILVIFWSIKLIFHRFSWNFYLLTISLDRFSAIHYKLLACTLRNHHDLLTLTILLFVFLSQLQAQSYFDCPKEIDGVDHHYDICHYSHHVNYLPLDMLIFGRNHFGLLVHKLLWIPGFKVHAFIGLAKIVANRGNRKKSNAKHRPLVSAFYKLFSGFTTFEPHKIFSVCDVRVAHL